MFRQTFTLWRRLIGATPTVESATAVDDDRRLWVRYATDLEGEVQLPDKGQAGRLLAQIRNLSLGGASLLIDQSLQAGQMLTLEMPSAGGEIHTVLACVVRAASDNAGKWLVGCVFSRELTDTDLKSFGAQKTQAGDDDQRVWVRYDCAVKARYRQCGEQNGEPQPVHVLDISASGIGLLVSAGVASGTLLSVDLCDKNGRQVCSILACVVHTTHRSDGNHALGCNFIRELSEEELGSLL